MRLQAATTGMRLRSASIPRSDFARSLLLHAIGLAGYLLFLFYEQGVSPTQQVIPVLPSLKVDLVALPDQIKPLPSIRTPHVPVPEPEPPAHTRSQSTPSPTHGAVKNLISLQPKPAVQKSQQLTSEATAQERRKAALSRLRAIEEVAESASAAPSLAKGNRLSEGTATSGDAKENSETAYYANVLEHMRGFWSLPVWLARRKDLQAQVQIHLDATGRLVKLSVVKSSGHPVFDEQVQSSIKSAQPYPLPPPELRNAVRHFGILLGFPL